MLAVTMIVYLTLQIFLLRRVLLVSYTRYITLLDFYQQLVHPMMGYKMDGPTLQASRNPWNPSRGIPGIPMESLESMESESMESESMESLGIPWKSLEILGKSWKSRNPGNPEIQEIQEI